jgi:hypothetical protein
MKVDRALSIVQIRSTQLYGMQSAINYFIALSQQLMLASTAKWKWGKPSSISKSGVSNKLKQNSLDAKCLSSISSILWN